MRVSITYRNYPLSKELTEKSRRIATLTSPLAGLMWSVVPGVLGIMVPPKTSSMPFVLMLVGMAAGLVLSPIIRKKQYAKLDAEYAKIQRAAR